MHEEREKIPRTFYKLVVISAYSEQTLQFEPLIRCHKSGGGDLGSVSGVSLTSYI